MGKASISINIGALWNGESAIKQTNTSLNTLTQAAKLSSDALASSAAVAGEKWVDVGYRVQNIGNAIEGFGDSLTKNITEPATALGGYCVNQATSYDTALANLNKTANLTADELQEFGDAAIEASKTSPVTDEDILNAEALGAQLGISNENLREFADTATGLDIATNMGVEEASTEMARFLNIMNESDSKTSNYGSTIVDLGNNFATTESEIANMSERLAGASANTKLSSQEIMGMATAMSSLGIKAEAGGSSMTTILNNISAAVNSGSDTVEEYAKTCGISADVFAAKWKEAPIEALELMITKAHEMVENGGNLTETLEAWGVSGIRQTDVMSRLINNDDILTEAVDRANTAWEENTALTTEVEKRNESLESRFQTLENRADATATKVGVTLAEGLLNAANSLVPLLDKVDGAVDAFNNLDTPTKTAVTNMGLVAVAAGPVISGVGKVVTAMGKVTTKFGEFVESGAVLRASLNETDGSLLRTYASSDKVSSAIGLAGNKALEAAGGVDNYVKAWEGMESAAKQIGDMNDKVIDLTAKQGALEAAGKGGTAAYAKLGDQIEAANGQIKDLSEEFATNANKITKWTGSTKEMEKALERGGESVEGLVSNLEETETSLTTVATESEATSSAITGMGKVAMTVGANLAKAFFVTAAISAVTYGVGLLIEKFTEAKEKEELLNDVSQNAATIFGESADAASGYGDAIGDIAIDSDSTLQKVKELNDSLGESMTEFYTSSAYVDQYLDVIDELAGKSSLTATEQWKLEQAVEGLNEVTGSAYQITDDYRVVLEDENGKTEVSTQLIHDNAEAWRDKAEAEAYAAKAKEYLEAEVEAQMKLQQAQEQLSAAQERRQELVAKGTKMTAEERDELNTLAQTTIPDLKTKVDDLSTAYQSTAQSTDFLTTKSEIAASSLSDSLKAALNDLPSTAMNAASQMANNFQAGITAGTVTPEQAELFVGNVKTSLANLPTDTQAYGAAAAAALSQAVSDGSVSASAASAVLSAAVRGDITDLPAAFKAKGLECPEDLAAAISAYASLPANATQQMKDAIVLNLAGGDVVAAAEMLGRDIDAGLAEAIQNNNTEALNSMGITSQEVIDKARDTYQTHSPSVVFQEIGANLNQGLAAGINGDSSPITAIGDLATNVINGITNLPDTLSTIGTNASSLFASGIGSAKGNTSSNAAALLLSAKNGTSGTPDALSRYGTSASSSFASGIYAHYRSVVSNAASMASAAAKMGEGNYYQSGSHASQNFANGISAGTNWVASAARSVAQAAKNALGFSVPKEGPWSGAEKGGETSGRHLVQNFARGMLREVPTVTSAANSVMGSFAFATGGNTQALAAAGAGTGNNIYINGVNVNDYADMVSATRDYLNELNRIGKI